MGKTNNEVAKAMTEKEMILFKENVMRIYMEILTECKRMDKNTTYQKKIKDIKTASIICSLLKDDGLDAIIFYRNGECQIRITFSNVFDEYLLNSNENHEKSREKGILFN